MQDIFEQRSGGRVESKAKTKSKNFTEHLYRAQSLKTAQNVVHGIPNKSFPTNVLFSTSKEHYRGAVIPNVMRITLEYRQDRSLPTVGYSFYT